MSSFLLTSAQKDTTSTEPTVGGSGGSFENIGLAIGATTAIIKITGANGTALSAGNPGYVRMRSNTVGQMVTVEVTADVNITLTGAHWNFDTAGDLTNYPLSVLACYDGALKWGVAPHGGVNVVLDADDSATQASITAWDHVLVNSALTADATALHLGHFLANFDDTGGASENLWAIQTGINSIVLGGNQYYLRQRKYNAAEVTATGDVAALTFSNFRAGIDIVDITGQLFFADTGTNQADVNVDAEIQDNTTPIAEIFWRLQGTIDIDSRFNVFYPVVNGYTMVNTALTLDLITMTAAGLQGDAGATDTSSYLQVSLRCPGGSIPKAIRF